MKYAKYSYELGISRTSYCKYKKLGYPLERALEIIKKNRDSKSSEWRRNKEQAKINGISYQTFVARIKAGWSETEATNTPTYLYVLSDGTPLCKALGKNRYRRAYELINDQGYSVDEAYEKVKWKSKEKI